MPEQWTEDDVARILEATRQGKLPSQVARELNEPPAGLYVPGSNPGDDEGQRRMAAAERALHNDSMPPGPTQEDTIDAAIKAGHQYGGPGTKDGMAAYVDVLMKAAERGDPNVISKGTPNAATNERWMQNAKDRAIRARDHQRRNRL